MKPTTAEIISKLEELDAEAEYDHYGVRTQEQPFELGPMDHRSSVWVDGYETDEELDGLSVTMWTGHVTDIKAHASDNDTHSEYFGDHVAIIGFTGGESGADMGEIVARDPEVIYIF